MLNTSLPFDPTTPLPMPNPASRRGWPIGAGPAALAPGTCLGEFEIVRLLGSGGFGIVYLAHDRLLLRQVAIKEYMPATLAGRRHGETVLVHHESAAAVFAAGLASFLNEAQLLARFDHPSLVKVYRFWQANNTAYMAMPYYKGRTLKDARLAMRNAPDETWLRSLVEPLLSALELLHREGIFHRDVSPDNIMILPDGRPVLLDLGSARRAIGSRTEAMTVLLKPNFAPVEQYGDNTTLRQGPWTDLYALGATLRFALTGEAPMPSVLRAIRDDLAPLAGSSHPPLADVSTRFLATIDWALTLSPAGRPQDVSSLRHRLRGAAAPQVTGAGAAEATPRSRPWRRPGAVVAVAVGAIALAATAGAGWIALRGHAVAPQTAAQPAPLRSPVPASDTPRTPARALPEPATLPIEAPAATANLAPTPPTSSVALRRAARKTRVESAPPAAPPSPSVRATALAESSLEACAGLGFFARQMCAMHQCRKVELQEHPQCVERHRADEDRQRRMQQL